MPTPLDTIDPLSRRWTLRRDLEVRCECFGGRVGLVIEDPLSGRFYQIGEAEYRFLTLFDGKQTLQDIVAESSSLQPIDAFSQAEALALVRWAGARGLLCQEQGAAPVDPNAAHSADKPAAKFNPFFIKIPLDAAHRDFERFSRRLGWMFSTGAAIAFAAVWVLVLIYILPRSESFLRWDSLWHPQNWLGLGGIWLLLKVWHEFGHATACQRFGGTIRSAGVALICFAPVAYVDATSTWRIPSKWRRILVSLAGIYFEGWVAAFALLFAAVCRDEFLRTWACHTAMVAGGQTLLVNANPLVRFDGYYILADLIELPNLHALSRQTVANVVRRLTGDSQAVNAPVVGKRQNFVVVYACASVVWQIVMAVVAFNFFVFQRETLGAPLAWTIALVWLAVLVSSFVRMGGAFKQWKPRTNRIALAGAAILLTAVGAGWWLFQPTTIRAAGVLDFSPMTVLRASADGMVDEVTIADGDYVRAGDPIIVLKNEELENSVADLRLQIRQSKVQIQALGAQQLLAKRSNEEANCRSLETQLHELEDKAAALILRAPHDGRIIAREIQTLAGKFLHTGDEIGILGGDDTLHVIAVFSQYELNAVRKSGQRVEVVLGASRDRFLSESVRVEPAAGKTLPHEALSGVNGGPIAMQTVAATPEAPASFEPLAPVFIAYVRLPPGMDGSLYAGERAAVRFVSPQYRRIQRLFDLAAGWFQKA